MGEQIEVGQFWEHQDGRKLEVTGVIRSGENRVYPDGLVFLRVWFASKGQHCTTKMKPERLRHEAVRWHLSRES